MQLTVNTRAFIEAEQYSSFILMNLHDGLLPGSFYREVSDFLHGDTLNIKTIGTVTLQEAEEDVELVYNPIESGNITFQITEYKGDAWYITDDLREDGNQIEQLQAARAVENTRAIQEVFESDFFRVASAPYAAGNTGFPINGFNHFVVSSEGNNTFSTDHLVDMRLAFDKANVPHAGRVVFVDPVVEATLNKLVTITHDVTPFGEEILRQGLSNGMTYRGNWFGWNIIVSNRLYTGAADDGATQIADGVYNLFMCVLDDQTKPIMGAWRRQPKVEGERNKDRARDEWVVRCRYGFGVQRMDTLGCVVTDRLATTAS